MFDNVIAVIKLMFMAVYAFLILSWIGIGIGIRIGIGIGIGIGICVVLKGCKCRVISSSGWSYLLYIVVFLKFLN